MRLKFVHGLRACFAAVALVLAVAHAAQPKEPSPIGLTQDQVIARYGEPKSQIAAGNRVIMFFARDRLVLRDGVVVEAEKIAAEPKRTPPPPPAPVAPATASAAAPATGTGTPTAPETAPAPAPTPAPPVERTGAAGAVPAAPATAAPAAPVAVDALDPNAAAPKPEPTLEIKSVRPPSSNYAPRPVPPRASVPPAAEKAPTTPPVATIPAPAKPQTPAPVPPPEPTPPATTPMPAPALTTTADKPAVAGELPAAATVPAVPPTPVPEATAPTDEPTPDPAALAKKEKDKKLRAVRARRRIAEAGDADEPELTEAFLTGRTLTITFIVVGAGVAYLLWRNRQRQLLLKATAVSHSPFTAAADRAGAGGTAFTADLLAKLEWKRFEELVANYYSKTGVVAVRTKTGPASPVHIKISWKGEPQPFACVQCIAHPIGLIDAKPLQELVTVLAAEDIRRGYVVTAGKFGVSARDFAEEKHLTLLPGDIFLEKLNALPEAARSEIMQAVTTGDYQTPSCPKCEAKMVKSSEDPSQWRCLTHADQVIPAWR